MLQPAIKYLAAEDIDTRYLDLMNLNGGLSQLCFTFEGRFANILEH